MDNIFVSLVAGDFMKDCGLPEKEAENLAIHLDNICKATDRKYDADFVELVYNAIKCGVTAGQIC